MKTICALALWVLCGCAHGITLQEGLQFAAGFAGAHALHEAGHIVAAEATGTTLTWRSGTYNQIVGFEEDAQSDSAGQALYAAGMTAQLVGSEIVLQSKIDKNTALTRGFMAWNVLNPVLYALDYWWLRSSNARGEDGSYCGDLSGLEHYSDGRTANAFAAATAAIALFQGWRFMQTQSWAPQWCRRIEADLAASEPGALGISMIVRF